MVQFPTPLLKPGPNTSPWFLPFPYIPHLIHPRTLWVLPVDTRSILHFSPLHCDRPRSGHHHLLPGLSRHIPMCSPCFHLTPLQLVKVIPLFPHLHGSPLHSVKSLPGLHLTLTTSSCTETAWIARKSSFKSHSSHRQSCATVLASLQYPSLSEVSSLPT